MTDVMGMMKMVALDDELVPRNVVELSELHQKFYGPKMNIQLDYDEPSLMAMSVSK
jgi:hypothetical protein